MPTDNPVSAARTSVRIVVVGDRGTGKSSLIAAAAGTIFRPEVPTVLPPTRIPSDYYPEWVPITAIDTSFSLENWGKLKRADAVVLTYACDEPSTMKRLGSFWLHELRRLKIKAPVVVAACKVDRVDRESNCRDERRLLEQYMESLMKKYREIQNCLQCSTSNRTQVEMVFCMAQKAVLHPTPPLFDRDTKVLRPRCVSALKRIFILCDRDMDGALSDEELNESLVKCFSNWQLAGITYAKGAIQDEFLPRGFNKHGLTKVDFLSLHARLIKMGEPDITWPVLRKFGYDDELKLSNDYLSISNNNAPDQCKTR